MITLLLLYHYILKRETESFYLLLEKKPPAEDSLRGNLDLSVGHKKNSTFFFEHPVSFSYALIVHFATCMSALGQGSSACMRPKSGSEVPCVFSKTTRASARSRASLKDKMRNLKKKKVFKMMRTLQLCKLVLPFCPGQVDHLHRTHLGHLKHE